MSVAVASQTAKENALIIFIPIVDGEHDEMLAAERIKQVALDEKIIEGNISSLDFKKNTV